jgi:hypothetical protein
LPVTPPYAHRFNQKKWGTHAYRVNHYK